MEMNLEFIRKIILIMATGIILLNFIIMILTTNKNSPNFIEYTDLSRFFLNLYTFTLLALILGHSIYPKILCNIFTKKLGIITTVKGKIILLSSIFIMYFGTGNKPQKIFGMIAFIATFCLFLSNLFLKCKNVNFGNNNNAFVEEKIKNQVMTTTTASFNSNIK